METHKAIEKRASAGGISAYISGTRVRVSDVARLYRLAHEEHLVERVLRSLPHLTAEQVSAALDYWRRHEKEIEGEILEEESLISKMPNA